MEQNGFGLGGPGLWEVLSGQKGGTGGIPVFWPYGVWGVPSTTITGAGETEVSST